MVVGTKARATRPRISSRAIRILIDTRTNPVVASNYNLCNPFTTHHTPGRELIEFEED